MKYRQFLMFSMLALVIFCNSVSSQTISEDKAIQVLDLANKVIYKKLEKKDVKSVFIQFATKTGSETEFGNDSDAANKNGASEKTIANKTTKLSFEFPSKFAVEERVERGGIGNYSEKSEIFNNGELNSRNSLYNKGEDVSVIMAARIPEMFQKQKDLSDAQRKTNTANFMRNRWQEIFPIFLFTSWNTANKFTYIGKSEVGGTKVDVIEAQAEDFTELKLFFDENSHKLLALTSKVVRERNGNKATMEETRYFKDYKEMHGLLIPTRIISSGHTNVKADGLKGAVTSVMGGSTKSTSEIIIEKFELNSKFKPSTFSVN